MSEFLEMNQPPKRLTENELNNFSRLWLVVVGNHDWTRRWPGARRLG